MLNYFAPSAAGNANVEISVEDAARGICSKKMTLFGLAAWNRKFFGCGH
jgi:hypothetical protein